MVLVASGLHGEVESAGAGVLGWRGAGDYLKLVYCVEVNALGHESIVALLVDGRGRHAVDVELTEVVAGTADDGHTYAGLCAGSEGGEGGRVALRVVHLEGEVGVGGVFHHETDGCVGGIEDRRRGANLDGLCRLADGQYGIEAEDAEGVDDEVVLLKTAKACRCDVQGVGSGGQGSNVEEAGGGRGALSGDTGGDIGRDDGRVGDCGTGRVGHSAGDGARTCGLGFQGDWNCDRQGDDEQEKSLEEYVCQTATKDVFSGSHDDLDRNKFREQSARL